MEHFITRVMLHDAVGDDYERLHAAMAGQKFLRTITGSDGVVYHLPWAEYSSQGEINAEGVRDLCKLAIQQIQKTGEVLVTQAKYSAFSNLRPVIG